MFYIWDGMRNAWVSCKVKDFITSGICLWHERQTLILKNAKLRQREKIPKKISKTL